MMNSLMLLAVTTGAALPGPCSHAQVHPRPNPSLIVVHSPKGKQGDFRICDDGRVLVDPVRHPKSCF
ncbi:hypothetical protein [Paraburkholderia oxyphila]|uniref:hypothetical protein n=1 Tax=Paraburkholderia oxyphila TaxID=614212 RepID=UPI0005BB0DDC|nr:hypothetical protein [Paraburkholderia oxyphila]